MPMVSYQTFVKLSFDEARRKGAQFDGIDSGGDFLEDVAAVWSQDKQRIKQLTEQQARSYIQRRVSA